jgi:hypothetical protein
VYDWSTGLLYKGGRYFDPMLGIWLALMPLMVVVQRRGQRKTRRGLLWIGLLLLVTGVGGSLTACSGQEMAASSLVCVQVFPSLSDLPYLAARLGMKPNYCPDNMSYTECYKEQGYLEGRIIFLRLRYDYAMERRHAETITLMRLR